MQRSRCAATSTRREGAPTPTARSAASMRSSGSRPARTLTTVSADSSTTLSPACGSCAAARQASSALARFEASVHDSRCRQHATSWNNVTCVGP